MSSVPDLDASLGLILSHGPGPAVDWPDAASWFGAVEAAGCGAFWLTDHLFFPDDTPDALTMAAVAAVGTTSASIGTGVLQLPLRQAAAVAKAATTVAALAPGRFVLGVGVGEHRQEYDLAGASFTGRGAAMDRGLAELRRLWEPAEGWFVQRPVPERPPIWIGGRSPAALDRVARTGDGWFPMFVGIEGFERRNADLDQRLRAVGRAPEDVARAVVLVVSVDRPGWSADDARSWASALFRTPSEALTRLVLTGSAGAGAARIQAYRDAGAGHVAILAAGPDPLATYTALQAELR